MWPTLLLITNMKSFMRCRLAQRQ